MIPLTYRQARSEQEAIAAAYSGGRYIAGGTTLIDLMREEVERPEHLIDIKRSRRSLSMKTIRTSIRWV